MTNLYNPLLAIAALHNNQKDFKANLHRAELEHLQGAALIQALQKETKKKKEAKQTTWPEVRANFLACDKEKK